MTNTRNCLKSILTTGLLGAKQNSVRHCEEQSDEAIQGLKLLDRHASPSEIFLEILADKLVMTEKAFTRQNSSGISGGQAIVSHTKKPLGGFTIVELLVVVAVIAVLAAITLVSYSGISSKAIAASLRADLSSAAGQLKAYAAENGTYPNSILDCPNPSIGSLCVKASGGNVYSSYSPNNTANSPSFSLLASNGNQTYKVTNDSAPAVVASAPLSPVADWLAVSQGDHYGNFYDLITKQYATVSRSTVKTIYDHLTQKIYDVPANYLAISPRGDGKSGSEAVIEESRTNYLPNSYGSINDGSQWATSYWHIADAVAGTPAASLVQGVYRATAQRITYSSGNETGYVSLVGSPDAGAFSAGDTVTLTAYCKIAAIASSAFLRIYALDSASSILGTATVSLSPTDTFKKFAVTYNSLPSGTARVIMHLDLNFNPNQTADATIDAVQLEKGPFATSYIPTTTTTATRAADNVKIPASSLSASTGTVASVRGTLLHTGSSWPWNVSGAFGWMNNNGNFIDLEEQSGSTYAASVMASSTYAGEAHSVSALDYVVQGGEWSVGSVSKVYQNSTAYAGTVTLSSAPVGLPSIAYIGSLPGNYYANGPIQRVVLYSSALSDSDEAILVNAIKDGP